MENTEDNTKGQKKTKNTKENIERKPSIKVKTGAPPPVRQTLTSYKRMLKANPLLKYKEAGIDIDELYKSKGSSLKAGKSSEITESNASCTLEGKSVLREFKKPEMKTQLKKTQSLKLPKSNGLDVSTQRISIISGNLVNKLSVTVSSSSNNNTTKPSMKLKTDVMSKNLAGNRVEQKKALAQVKAKVNSFHKHLNPAKSKPSTNPETKCLPKKRVSLLRRSLSSGHLQSKKGAFDPKQAYIKVTQSQSEENLNVPTMSDAQPGFSPIMEESNGSKNLIFKTPSAYERRSICYFTPRSVRKSSLFQASTPAPVELQRLQERLNKWLKSRGKPLALFHHLRCFGIEEVEESPLSTPVDDDNKENIEVIQENSQSYEDLKISVPAEESKSDLPVELPAKQDIPEEELAKVAKEAMVELQKLIEEDYPRAQCLGWLELIREKYKKAVDEPEYWECRAAIEQSLGNVGNAVEFYKTAIVQGAEVSNVDKSLDQLLKKFSLLNISPSKSEQNKASKKHEKIVREARSVFKSTIIQFAIQERKLKKGTDESSSASNSKKLVATPVRRSTRLSRSAYVSTPGVTLCTSLKDINLSANEINFEKNKALC